MELMASIYLFVAFFILAGVTDYLPFLKSARKISAFSKSSISTIQRNDLDDDGKQKILLGNSLGIFKESLKIFLFVIVLAGLFFLLLKAGEYFFDLSETYLVDFLASAAGIGLSVVAFLSYFLIRKLYARF